MRKIFFCFLLFAAVSSCKDESKVDAVVAGTNETDKTPLPVSMSYQGEVSLGKRENIATVMNWNTAMVAGDIDKAVGYLADSITVAFHDGERLNTSKDSVLVMLKGWRNSMDSISQTYVTAVALDNTTAGDQWVVQWTNEGYHYKGGKTESHNLSESYRLVDGKIREVIQYAQKLPVKK